MKQELDPANIVEEEEEEEEECRKFSPKHCQKLQFSIAQIMGFDSSEASQNAGQEEEGDAGHQDGDQSDQGHLGDQSDQMGRGRWSEEGEGLTKDVKVDINLLTFSINAITILKLYLSSLF